MTNIKIKMIYWILTHSLPPGDVILPSFMDIDIGERW